LTNSQCTVGTSGSSSSGSGTNLTVNVALSFTPALGGAKTNYMVVYDTGGLSPGWQAKGTWTVPGGGGNLAPSAVSVTPNAGSGSSQTFSYVFSDPNGYADVSTAQMMINSTLSVAGGCWMYYSRASNQVWLMNNAGTAWLGPVTLGPAGTLSNSQCTVNAGGSSSSGSGTNLTVNVVLSFTPAFGGAKTNYMVVYDAGGLSPGWQANGAWTVP